MKTPEQRGQEIVQEYNAWDKPSRLKPIPYALFMAGVEYAKAYYGISDRKKPKQQKTNNQ